MFATPIFLLAFSFAATPVVEFTVQGGKVDQTNVVVTISIAPIAVSTEESGVRVSSSDGKTFLAQLTGKDQLTVLIPELKAGQKIALEAKFGAKVETAFTWKDAEGSEPVLMRQDKPILRYVRLEFDPKATPAKKQANANPTFKVYHHLYAADGKTLLTNGADGVYPHHRGVFFGFNRISYDGKTADIWHGFKGEHQSHDKVLASEAGLLFGREKLAINWFGADDKVFANEVRTLTVYNTAGGTLIQFDSTLRTELDKVKLDGDPQHAGFHFRANSEVEKTPKETYFLRPDGKGEMGKEKNWDKGKGPVNLPWNAMSFLLGDKRYTALYLDHPDNPKEARQSERAYGRIGTYFEYELAKDKPLQVKYRLWVQEGEMTVEQCQALSRAFTESVAVVQKAK
jgi:hypothetical protein